MTKSFKQGNLKVIRPGDIGTFREALALKQGGICPICGKDLIRPCLDHHHKKRIKGTGQIRGVLCNGCNIMLGKVENNCKRYGINQEDLPEVLRHMALYLEKEPLPYIHPSDAAKPLKLKKSSYNKLCKVIKFEGRGRKAPAYPKSGRLTKPLKKLYRDFKVRPEYYS